jgi:hypothetical protein
LAVCPVSLAEELPFEELPFEESWPDMTRSHRLAHRLIWPVLAIAVALGLTMALTLRPPPDPPAAAGSKS